MNYIYKFTVRNDEGTFKDSIYAESDSDAIAFIISEWFDADSYERNLELVKDLTEDEKVIRLMKKVDESRVDGIYLLNLMKVLRDPD